MTTDSETRVLEELRRVSRLLAILATKDAASQKDRIVILSQGGLQPREIADLLGTTPNAVSVALYSIRKQQTERTAGRGKKKA